MLNKIKTPAMEKLIHLFESNDFAIRLVGGVVRDLLCGLTPKDIDFCTDATPDEMVDIAKKQKVTTIPTGIDHGTLTFVIDGEQFEVTTLRVDEETDGRHATVKFVRNFEEVPEYQLLLKDFIDMGYNPDQDYSFEELMVALRRTGR